MRERKRKKESEGKFDLLPHFIYLCQDRKKSQKRNKTKKGRNALNWLNKKVSFLLSWNRGIFNRVFFQSKVVTIWTYEVYCCNFEWFASLSLYLKHLSLNCMSKALHSCYKRKLSFSLFDIHSTLSLFYVRNGANFCSQNKPAPTPRREKKNMGEKGTKKGH